MTVSRQRGRRRLRVLMAGALVVLLAVGVTSALYSSLFAVRHVTVLGSAHTPAAVVETVAGLSVHPPMLDVDPGRSSQRLEETLPWVAKALVTRHWPDSVTVTITERVPLAAVKLAPGKVAVVDATGRVLADEPTAPPGTVFLSAPGIPGPPGSVLGEAAGPALAVAQGLPAQLKPQVSAVLTDGGSDVKLDLGGGLSANLGPPNQLSAKFEALESLLAVAPVKGPAVIDLTVPSEPTVSPVAPASSGQGAGPPPA